MNFPTGDLVQLAMQIEQATDMQHLWSSLVSFYHDAGFGGIIYAVFSPGKPGEMSIQLREGVAEDVHQAFIDLGHARHDVNYRFALATGRPALRSRTLRETTLSPEEQEHHRGWELHNFGDTLALPVFGPNNYTGIISLGRPASPRLFEEACWTPLHMAALSVHLKALELQSKVVVEPHSLSEREVEVLCWVAQGKSNAVIAEILSIAVGTVDTYLRRIFEKLNVADRTSAAVKGFSMGLIRL